MRHHERRPDQGDYADRRDGRSYRAGMRATHKVGESPEPRRVDNRAGWQFHVAPEGAADALGDDAWYFEEYRYHWPDGGWVHADVSRECIRRAVSMWRSAGRP